MTWVTGTPRMLARSATLTTAGNSIGPASAARAAVAFAASARRSKASSWPRRPPRVWPGRFAGRERCIGLGIDVFLVLFVTRRAGDRLRGAAQPLGMCVQRAKQEVILRNHVDFQSACERSPVFERGLPAGG